MTGNATLDSVEIEIHGPNHLCPEGCKQFEIIVLDTPVEGAGLAMVCPHEAVIAEWTGLMELAYWKQERLDE